MARQIETLHLKDVIRNHTRDMTDRIVAVTGTTSGTGYVCAREIARLGGTVLLLNRRSERSDSSLDRLKGEVPEGRFDSIACDLQDYSSVRGAVMDIRSRYDVIDVLCNNAGVMAMKDIATGDGYDIQMQTNCLSHFLLTKELFPLLKNSAEARVVNHTSGARMGSNLGREYFGRNGGRLGGDGTEEENAGFTGPRWERYHQTKLANCAFTYGLKLKMDEQGIGHIKALLAHPGLARTNLQLTTAETGGMQADSPLMERAQSAEDGALGILRACADPEAESGHFFGPKGWTGFPDLLPPEDLLTDPENIRINWEGCEAAVGEFSF